MCQSEEQLREATQEMLNNARSRAYLFGCYGNILRQYNLSSKYAEHEILNDAYMRAVRYIRKKEGNTIRYLRGWYVSTGRNIVKEIHRSEKKQADIASEISKVRQEFSKGTEYESITEAQIIEKLNKYTRNEKDSWIIFFRLAEDMKWGEVCGHLIDSGFLVGPISKKMIDSTKQRFHRAIKKLPKDIELS
jgi:uncharacterized protein (UPF0335 family)